MKGEDFLDDYVIELLNNSRAEEPVLSLDEVSKTLDIMVPKKAGKGWGFYLAGLTGMLVLFSLIFWFLLPQNKLENATKSMPKLPKIGFKESQNSKPALVQNSSPKSLFVPTQILHEDSATLEENRVPRFVDVPFLVSNFDFEENEKELVLSFEELAKLGIYTDGCELKYTNLRDSMFLDRKAIKKHGPSFFFYTEIQSNGGSYTLHNAGYLNDSLWNLYQDSLWPAYPMLIERFVTASTKGNNLYGLDSLYYIIEPKSNELIASQYVSEVKSLLVPIKVSLKAVANKYGKTDHDVIFWFKPNEAFKGCLTDKDLDWVNKNYSHYKNEKYSNLINNLVAKKHQHEEGLKKDSVIFTRDLLNALVLNDKQLKSLGFKKNSNGVIKYKVCYQKKLIEVHRLGSQFTPSFNFIGNYGFMGFLKGINTNFPAHFVTDKGVNFYQLTKETNMHTLNSYDKNFQNRQWFKEEKDTLVPILIRAKGNDGTLVNWYFWFSKTDAFYKAIQQ